MATQTAEAGFMHMKIHIGATAYDTGDVSTERPTSGEPALYAIHFDGKLLHARAFLEKNIGLTVLRYHPDRAYLCLAKPEQIAAIERDRNAEHVHAVVWFRPAWKVPPDLAAGRDDERAYFVVEAARAYADALRRVLLDARAAVEHVDDDDDDASIVHMEAAIGSLTVMSLAEQLAKLEYVLSVSPCYALESVGHRKTKPRKNGNGEPVAWHRDAIGWYTVNDDSGESTDQPIMLQPGQGSTIAVIDSGLDTGAQTDHPEFDRQEKPVAGRAHVQLARSEETLMDLDGHGTNCAGLAVGAIMGIAPSARLAVFVQQDYRNITAGTHVQQGMWKMATSDPFSCDIVNNSFGVTPTSTRDPRWTYDERCRLLDERAWKRPNVIFVCSAGNQADMGNQKHLAHDDVIGSDVFARTVGAPAMAKNALAVGYIDNLDRLSPHSGRGDGTAPNVTVKPDLVAPGVDVWTARSHATLNQTKDERKQAFQRTSGSSMAAPIVAGAAALVRQYAGAKLGRSPSAALVRAALIAGTRCLDGYRVGDMHQGWGALDLERTLHASTHLVDDALTEAQDEKRYRITIGEGAARELKIALVWNDPGGAAAVNQLYLCLTTPTDEKYLSILRSDDGQSGLSSHEDACKRASGTVQVIYLASTPPGVYTLDVRSLVLAQLRDDETLPYGLACCGEVVSVEETEPGTPDLDDLLNDT